MTAWHRVRRSRVPKTPSTYPRSNRLFPPCCNLTPGPPDGAPRRHQIPPTAKRVASTGCAGSWRYDLAPSREPDAFVRPGSRHEPLSTRNAQVGLHPQKQMQMIPGASSRECLPVLVCLVWFVWSSGLEVSVANGILPGSRIAARVALSAPSAAQRQLWRWRAMADAPDSCTASHSQMVAHHGLVRTPCGMEAWPALDQIPG